MINNIYFTHPETRKVCCIEEGDKMTIHHTVKIVEDLNISMNNDFVDIIFTDKSFLRVFDIQTISFNSEAYKLYYE